MISIIIPIFNSSKYIIQTLHSCYNQTYKYFEIIIIDDFSTDNSSQLIFDEIKINKDIKISYYLNKEKGISNARNYGIINSRGEYLYFLDSDDILIENAFEVLLQHVSKFDIVIGNWVNFNDNDNFVSDKSFVKSFTNDISKYWSIKPPICFLVKRSNVFWDINLNTWEVNDYVLGNYFSGMNLCLITDIVLKVRQHNSINRASIANDHFGLKKTLETFTYIYYKYHKIDSFNSLLRANFIKDIISISYRLQVKISKDIELEFKNLVLLNDFKYFSLFGFAYLFGNRGIKLFYIINKLFGRV